MDTDMGTTGIRTGITTGTTTDVEGNRRARPGCLVALVFFPGLKVDEYSAIRLRRADGARTRHLSDRQRFADITAVSDKRVTRVRRHWAEPLVKCFNRPTVIGNIQAHGSKI